MMTKRIFSALLAAALSLSLLAGWRQHLRLHRLQRADGRSATPPCSMMCSTP